MTNSAALLESTVRRGVRATTGSRLATASRTSRFVELALAFHHTVRSEDQELAAVIGRLRT
ncbi:hypothetical protein ACFY8B_30255 [Streptomyces sp. NPDC012751]|uniref:hypothetical protein n=1 Tax=Streptomyces sp. NPDC012751 TaxID=3364846 RepID=UPI003686CE7A